VTGGRTHPSGARHFDLLDVVARSPMQAHRSSDNPERARILDLCIIPITVAELAAAVRLPLGVVRVLLDDLVREGLIDIRTMAPRGRVTDTRLLQKVLDGLHAL
jgi:hypothetical protein